MTPSHWPGPGRCPRTPSTRTSLARSALNFSLPLAGRIGRGFLLEGAGPGDLLADGEHVDLVRPFVRKDRFEVIHVAHDGIFEADAVRAQDASCLAGDLQRLSDVVELSHRDLGGRH